MKKLVDIYVVFRLLASGLSQAQAAKKLKISRQAISKTASKLVLKGVLTKIGKYPTLYQKVEKKPAFNPKKVFREGHSDVNQDVNEAATVRDASRLFEPHKFGEWYEVLSGGLSGRFSGKFKRWFREEDAFSIVAHDGRNGQKVCFWLKKFKGKRPLEIVVKSRALLRERVVQFAEQHGVVLRFRKYAGALEWTTTEIEGAVNLYLMQKLGLKAAPQRIGNAIFFTDKSHLGLVEARSVDEKRFLRGATDAVRELDWVALGDARNDFARLMAETEKLVAIVGELAEGQKTLVDAVHAISEFKKPPSLGGLQDRRELF